MDANERYREGGCGSDGECGWIFHWRIVNKIDGAEDFLAFWMVGVQFTMRIMIGRPELVDRVEEGLACSPVTLILGPRQCGKTTLARLLGEKQAGSYYDLESPRDLARLAQPQTVLEAARGLVVLDEIQQRPDLMPLLRVLADRTPLPCRFLLLGSASPDLMKKSSETLAGRVHLVDMSGEVGLIFAMVGKQLGVMNEAMFSVIVMMVILTTLITPPVLTVLLRRQQQ